MADLRSKAPLGWLFNGTCNSELFVEHRPSNTAGRIEMTLQPKYAAMPHWCLISGMTRSATYLALADRNLRAIKQPGGRRTLIDGEHGLAWLNSQPAADFRDPRRRAVTERNGAR